MKHKIVVWGASGHALVVADILRLAGHYKIVGFLDDLNIERWNSEFCGATILGGREQLDILRDEGIEEIIFGVGDCDARLRLSEFARAKGFRLAKAIHPQAIVAQDVSIGVGTVICAGAVVNPGSKIGENVIINTCASVDHECVIEDGVHIGPGVHLGGRVRVARASWIGIGAIISDRIDIGEHSLIGAGAVVIKSVPGNVVALGVPAEIIRERGANDGW